MTPPVSPPSSTAPTEATSGCAAFQAQYAGRDIKAGIITGTMAIPLSIGIA